MFHKRLLSCFFLIGLTVWLAACTTTPPVIPETEQMPVEERQQVSFSDLPGWKSDNLKDVLPAFRKSCRAIGKKKDWQDVCAKAYDIDENDTFAIRSFFETHFVPYRIANENGSETGLATGYFEPLLKGSRVRKGKFRTALYRQPDDLLVVDLASAYPQLKGLRLRGKLDGNRVVPYETRAEIEKSGKLAGHEIVWVDDVLDAFFLEIQGSGRVYIPESGETIRLAYANQNGRPYRSIGRYLLDRGELKPGQASSQQIRQWIRRNPERLREVLDSNPSYVFFREERIDDPSEGPKGALGVPLTPERSIAIDPRHIPLGAPVFVDTTRPYSSVPLQKLMLAQDTGGAIRGAVRADYFWGFGPQAGEMAGKMKQKLKVWLLLPKQPENDK
ncbi:murein transglycosylase A [Oxalobacter aliiformigenes]|uniref:murein transglycosylase A n=1 Tax=Oxalobacter aliiformigenes TaxID=2946593 RepID=UPI0038B36826